MPSLLFRFARQPRLPQRYLFFITKAKYLLKILQNVQRIVVFSSLTGVNKHYSLPCMNIQVQFHVTLASHSFIFQVIFSFTSANQCSAEYSKRTLYRYPEFSFHLVFLLCILSCDLQLLWSLQILSSISLFRESSLRSAAYNYSQT